MISPLIKYSSVLQTMNKGLLWSVITGILFISNLLITSSLIAEGTKQIMPYDSCLSRLNLEPDFTAFAMYGCTPFERLNIHIANVGEKIYYGFGRVFDASQYEQFDLYYRIKDAGGNIVVNQSLIPSSGTGYISSHTIALAGPTIINTAGYVALSYTPTTTGDFYIEFYFNFVGAGDRREIEYFDITVTNAANQKIDGRVWSQEWQFTVTASPQPNPYDNPFYGEMYIYSDDSIVTSVDFNGLKPYVFAMSANETGTANTGNILQDRKSKIGKNTYPQYKIFLNDPDSIVYPSGIIGGFLSPLTFDGCPGNHCININTSKSGAIQLLIDLNGIPGYQIGTADLLIVQNVSAGLSCIPWNGNNGFGLPVAAGTVIKFKVTFVSGLTHLPIYDAEHNPNGYIISLVRPVTSTTTFNLYWDDSNFPGASIPPSTGCNSAFGCHIFNNMFGDQRTINTWWYAASNIEDSLTVIYSRIRIDSILITNASCPNISDGVAQIVANGGIMPYTYSINGGALQTSPVFTSLAIGNYSVTVADSNNCIATDTFSISSSPTLVAITTSSNDTCNLGNGSISIIISSGAGPFQYLWNTSPPSNTQNISNLLAGVYSLSITDAYNCVFNFTDSIINVPSGIFIVPTVLDDTCTNNMGAISLSISNTSAPLTYLWNTNPAQTTSSIQNLGAGLYAVTVTENGNCHTILNFSLNDMPPPSPIFTLPDKACVGDSVLVQYVGNQTPPENYLWSFGIASTLNGNNLGPYALNYLQIGMHYISLSVSKTGCPSSSYSDSIQLFKIIALVDSFKNVNCFGGNDGMIDISSIGGVQPYTYLWNPGGIGGSSNNLLLANAFEIIITDSIGCKAIVNQTISQPDALDIQLTPSEVSCIYLCDGAIASQVIGGTQPYVYQWSAPLFPNTISINNVCEGNYTLKIIDQKQCEDSASTYVGVRTTLLADFSYYFLPDYVDRNTVDFAFTGYGADSYLWDFGDFQGSTIKNPRHYYNLDTTYWVELIINSGAPDYCLDTARKFIQVLPPFNLFVPNAFTPNGDGKNDLFLITGNRVKYFQIYLYNRWGQLVFESNDILVGWNGEYKGVEAPLDVYSFIINVVGENDKTYQRIGTVTLIR